MQGNAVPVTTDAQTEDSPVLEVNGNQYLLTKDKTVIGRGSGCDIVIDDPASPASTWKSTSRITA